MKASWPRMEPIAKKNTLITGVQEWMNSTQEGHLFKLRIYLLVLRPAGARMRENTYRIFHSIGPVNP